MYCYRFYVSGVDSKLISSYITSHVASALKQGVCGTRTWLLKSYIFLDNQIVTKIDATKLFQSIWTLFISLGPSNPNIHPHSDSTLTSLTSYTNQFIQSAEEEEAELDALYQKFVAKKVDDALEKMDEKENEEDTAYLIEKTDQQSETSHLQACRKYM